LSLFSKLKALEPIKQESKTKMIKVRHFLFTL